MYSITKLVDIPYIFRRFSTLPAEMAAARMELREATDAFADAEREYGETQVAALEANADGYAACKNKEQRDHFEKLLYAQDAGVVTARLHMDTAKAELEDARDGLANLRDELTALRYTVRLVAGLTLGDDTIPANVLYDKLISALLDKREEVAVVEAAVATGNSVDTTLPAEFAEPDVPF